MKFRFSLMSRVAGAVFLAATISTLRAQLSIPSFTVDGGGGTSGGGGFTLLGTAGQPDAGQMSGGNFALAGGFWGAPSGIISAAPTLFIAPGAPGFAVVSWTPATPGFVLQSADALTPAAWTNAPSGMSNPVSVPLATGARFFRLHRP